VLRNRHVNERVIGTGVRRIESKLHKGRDERKQTYEQYGDERPIEGVALEEALLNSYYHGNLEISSDLRETDHNAYYQLSKKRSQEAPYCNRKIYIDSLLTPEECRFVIRDEGPGFDPTLLRDATDPANRLVAGELEARWNKALARVAEVESKIVVHDAARPMLAPDPASLATLATDLKTVWAAPTTDARLKKRIVRTLIQEVIADIDPEAAEIILVVHWIGGVHSEIRLPRRRRGQRNSTSADIIVAVCQLASIANDDLIAGILNRNGLLTGHGNRWTRERVTSLRSHHRIPTFKAADDGIEPWLNLSKAAQLLGISPRTLRLAAQAGEISAVHPLPDGPWIFSRAALSSSAARAIAEHARHNPKYPTGSHPDQQNLFSSIT